MLAVEREREALLRRGPRGRGEAIAQELEDACCDRLRVRISHGGDELHDRGDVRRLRCHVQGGCSRGCRDGRWRHADGHGSVRVVPVPATRAGVDLVDLRERLHVVLAAAEVRLRPFPDDGDRAVRLHAGADHQKVHVQALAALPRGLGVLARGGADAGHPVPRHRAADPALAEQDAEIDEALADGGGDRLGHGRVLHGSRAVRAEVEHRVLFSLERFDDGRLQGKADVIASDGDAHVISPRTS